MIQKDYLSEVEAAYVQGQVLVDMVPEDRLTSIWAVVGKDVHGFAAVIESKEQVGSSWLVNFSPVTEVVALRSGTQLDSYFDATKYSKKDLAMRFCLLSKQLDTEKLCSFEPTIKEVEQDAKSMGLFYTVATAGAVEEARWRGTIKGKVGYLKLRGNDEPELQLYRRLNEMGNHWKELHYITMQVLPLGEAQQKERLTLIGLRAALKTHPMSEWFELPYPVGTEWEKGQEIIAAILANFETVGEDFQKGHDIGQW